MEKETEETLIEAWQRDEIRALRAERLRLIAELAKVVERDRLTKLAAVG